MSDAKTNPLLQWRKSAHARDTEAYDRFGRVIGPGDMIQIAGAEWLLEVQHVKPDFTPRNIPGIPPGARLVELLFLHVNQAHFPGGMPIPELLKVLDLQERPKERQEYFAQLASGGNGSGLVRP